MSAQDEQPGANGDGRGRRGRQGVQRERTSQDHVLPFQISYPPTISHLVILGGETEPGPEDPIGREPGFANSPPNGQGSEDQDDDEEEEDDDDEEEIIARPTRGAKRRQQKRKRPDDDSDASSDGGNSVKDFMSMLRSRAGQVDHCELCLKKFTITPYTKTGPNGGLLCADCGRVMKDEKKPEVNKPLPKTKPSMKVLGKKRQVKSQIMNGTFKLGAKSLITLCVETLARNVDLVESFGDLAPHLVDKVAQRLSKRRLVDSNTFTLFLHPSVEELRIYDAAKLTEEDFISCFSICQKLHLLKFRNGIHFNDNVASYLASRNIQLDHLSVHGSNLLSDQAWIKLLAAKGTGLTTLKTHFTDKSFTSDVVAAVVKYCTGLKSLSLQHIAKLSSEGLSLLCGLRKIEHISLQLNDKITANSCEDLVSHVGKGLKTLSFRRALNCTDVLLCIIHKTCRNLSKFRLTECGNFSDKAFASLFTDWSNPPLEYVDLVKCRHMDSANARDPESGVGFGSAALKALMSHSGHQIRHLNLDSARYISVDAFEEVFSEGKVYPRLEYLELSFCGTVTDYVIEGIFKACPKLKELIVFGCMLVKGLVKVPRGKLLIGVPNVRG
ncbi:unnamed protein product [Parascedosporium putredinis]|uniref:DNA repair protein rhp7 treble clef domain-containing protein n=1 Tax=Parascedosporium putredinis TaxID=1442378 RepID=A0A9P1GU44_9PEZI|nr:unnamed protein product [Parascedosporium putredinis]CAI7987405.1 unnamed protein product [Parascedosporium putredinis]